MIQLRDKLVRAAVGQIVEVRSDDCPKIYSLHTLRGEATVELDRFRELEISPNSVTVKVLDVWQHRGGGFMVRCRIQHLADLPNLMHKRPWKPSTHDPLQSARDEPEQVSPATIADLTERSRHRMSAIKADEERKREARSIGNQTKEAIARARLNDVDVDENLHRLREELDEIRRKTDAA